MNRHPFRATLLAATVLVPLTVGCSGRELPADSAAAGTPAGGVTSTVSTGAATSETPPAAPAGGPPGAAASTAAPSYADAERAFQRGRYEEAAGMFETLSEREPDKAWGHYMLGLSSWKIGQHAQALEAFDAALRLEPSHRKSLLNSARVLLETGRPQDALNRVERALAIEPLSGEALRLQGRAHAELGQTAEAVNAYQRAIAIDGRDSWTMNNLGYLYLQQGRSDAALGPLARAVELRTNVPVFQNNFGTALERSGHLVAAREAYEAALAADSTYDKAAVALARVTARGPDADTSSVDVPALARAFQAEVEQWRTRSVRADSTAAPDSVVARDSANVGEIVSDSVKE